MLTIKPGISLEQFDQEIMLEMMKEREEAKGKGFWFLYFFFDIEGEAEDYYEAAIISAWGPISAIAKIALLRLSIRECKWFESEKLPDDVVPPPELQNRLLSGDEVKEIFPNMKGPYPTQ